MSLAQIINNQPQRVTGAEVLHAIGDGEFGWTSVESVLRWSEVDRNAVGIATITPHEPAPSGQCVSSVMLEIRGDAVVEVATFETAPVLVPARVSKLQAELYLSNEGLLASVVAKIVELVAGGQPAYEIYWRTTSYFERQHWALAALAYEMNWSPEFVDQMFAEAAQIT